MVAAKLPLLCAKTALFAKTAAQKISLCCNMSILLTIQVQNVQRINSPGVLHADDRSQNTIHWQRRNGSGLTQRWGANLMNDTSSLAVLSVMSSAIVNHSAAAWRSLASISAVMAAKLNCNECFTEYYKYHT